MSTRLHLHRELHPLTEKQIRAGWSEQLDTEEDREDENDRMILAAVVFAVFLGAVVFSIIKWAWDL